MSSTATVDEVFTANKALLFELLGAIRTPDDLRATITVLDILARQISFEEVRQYQIRRLLEELGVHIDLVLSPQE